jgi:hypothetical protein
MRTPTVGFIAIEIQPGTTVPGWIAGDVVIVRLGPVGPGETPYGALGAVLLRWHRGPS